MEVTKTAVFDLETIADPAAIPLLPDPEPDSRLKDPEKIKADVAVKRQKQIDGLGANPHTNLICCASILDLQKNVMTSFLLDPKTMSERDLLMDIWEHLFYFERFVTYNGIAFDVECLRFHSMLHNLPMAVRIGQNKYQTTNHLDLYVIISGGRPFHSGNMDFYCRRLGLTGKTEGMDGSQVQGYWNAGRYDEIKLYCEQDVRALAGLYQAMKGFYF